LVEVLWHGHSCFELRGKNVTIVTDPFRIIGTPDPEASADIVLVSHGHRDHSNVRPVLGKDGKVVDCFVGSTEVKGVAIKGVESFHDNSSGSKRGKNSLYGFSLDGVRFCHLGDLGHELSSSAVKELGTVDVLFVPVGGFFTIGPEAATKVCDELNPRITIPMHYRMPGLKARLMFGFLHSPDDFLKGKTNIEQVNGPSLIIEPDTLPKESKIIVLSLHG